MNILVTGGCGFIGSNFLTRFVPRFGEHLFINVDKLTYAANPASLATLRDSTNYRFRQVDIASAASLSTVFAEFAIDTVVHFAAESHVDRSIVAPTSFIETNIVGTFNLLEACRAAASAHRFNRYHHVSTDEVYGSLEKPTDFFTETSRYEPSSPYSASKAASDHLVRAYHKTFGLPISVTNCSNNYGPRQFPEKLIPLMILNALAGRELPIYGNGSNVRDWLYVDDHCDAIWLVLTRGAVGQTYNVGGNCELCNVDVVRAICRVLAELKQVTASEYERLIRFVKDRPGHDQRYAIDSSKIRRELGWSPNETFDSGLRKTLEWYLNNAEWIRAVQSGAYRSWLVLNYEDRPSESMAPNAIPAASKIHD